MTFFCNTVDAEIDVDGGLLIDNPNQLMEKQA